MGAAKEIANQTSKVAARLGYAKNYMRKIINMRLDLPHPTSKAYADLVRQAGEMTNTKLTLWQQAIVGLILVACIACSLALSVGWIEFSPKRFDLTQLATTKVAPPVVPDNGQTQDSATLQGGEQRVTPAVQPGKPTTAQYIDRDTVGVQWGHRLTIAIPLSIGLVFLILLLRQPKEIEKAVDSQSFSDALNLMAPFIQHRCGTPREVRRFQNYLRFLAAWDDSATRPKIGGVEAILVKLAATGVRTSDGEIRTDIDAGVIQFFSQQCEMLGLDPNTFRPVDEQDKLVRAASAASS